MLSGLFRKKDPICGMRQAEGKGFIDKQTGKWFCSEERRKKYCEKLAEEKKMLKEARSCCGKV